MSCTTLKTKKKTEQKYFVTGINCFAETACEQMMNTKRRFANKGTNVAFHGYQSFRSRRGHAGVGS